MLPFVLPGALVVTRRQAATAVLWRILTGSTAPASDRGRDHEGARAMYTCRICQFVVQFDDAVFPTKSGWCICLRCYSRETDQAKRVARSLQDEINREEGV